MKKVVYIANNMGTVQNCTKTKLHEGTHEDTFAQGDKIARRQFYTEGQFCMNDSFALRVIFAREYKNQRKKV